PTKLIPIGNSRHSLKLLAAQIGTPCTAQGIYAPAGSLFPSPSRLTARDHQPSHVRPALATEWRAPPNKPLNQTKGPEASFLHTAPHASPSLAWRLVAAIV